MAGRRQILFVCVENAGRSQMAQAFAEHLGLKAASTGTHPSPKVNATVVEVVKERGIGLSSHSPKMLTPETISQASLVVTMGCSVDELCPRPMLAQMWKKLVEWDLEDPKDRPIEGVRKIRDQIQRRAAEIATSRDEKET